jgi:Flp pilus assembly protein TadG
MDLLRVRRRDLKFLHLGFHHLDFHVSGLILTIQALNQEQLRIMLRTPKSRKPFSHSSRSGAAIIEFAVMSQIVLLILFGTIDVCSLYYLRQSAKLAAYEGCRIGLTASGTDLLVSNQATRLLNSRSIAGFTITTTPAVGSLTPGQLLTVRVTVPSTVNLPLRGWFTGSAPVVAEVRMASEK